MTLDEFIAFHVPALEKEPARHNLILGLLERAREDPEQGLALWSLDEPGACAIRSLPGHRGIILGAVSEDQARRLARELAGTGYPAVQGQGESAQWFAAEAETFGARFQEPERLIIHLLDRPPARPDAPGAPRGVAPGDAALLLDWTIAFIKEAGLGDALPSLENMEAAIARRRHFLWELDGQPVAMAGMGRRFRTGAAIAPVYTLPDHRGRGFGGAITAHVVDQIFASGRGFACLYTDADYAPSNRCYAKLGFEPVCESWVIRRAAEQLPAAPVLTAG